MKRIAAALFLSVLPLTACTNWHDATVTIKSLDCEKERCLDTSITPGTCNAAGNGSRYIMFSVMNASTQPARYRLEYNKAEITPADLTVPDHQILDPNDRSGSGFHTFWSSTYDKDITISTVQLRQNGAVVGKYDVTERLERC